MDLENMETFEKLQLTLNPNIPVEVLRELAADEDEEVRANVAENPNAPVDVLQELAKDEGKWVRYYVARNPNTTVDVLRDLAKDGSWHVREHVALNSKSSINTLVMQFEYEKSLRKPDPYVIEALYVNENLPAFAKVIIETLFGEMLT